MTVPPLGAVWLRYDGPPLSGDTGDTGDAIDTGDTGDTGDTARDG
jgi:hypothetical protein